MLSQLKHENGKNFDVIPNRHFFISDLNHIYCATSQLVGKLPELGKRSHFRDLEQAIGEAVETVNNQVARIRQIYILLDACFTPESCAGAGRHTRRSFSSLSEILRKVHY